MSQFFRRIKLVVAMVIVLGVPAGSVIGYYMHYHAIAVSLIYEKHMDTDRANAVKHAYAAAQLYSVLASVGFDESASQHIVLYLGKMNEYAEHFLRKKSKRDSNAEMMKDLLNNFIGIEAAKKHLDYAPAHSLLEWMIILAQKNILVTSASVVPDLSPVQPTIIADKASVSHVMWWFSGVQDTLTMFVDNALTTALDAEPAFVEFPEVEIKKAQVE